MKLLINKKNELDRCASTDASRYIINGIRFDAETKRLIATDGRRLAINLPIRVVDPVSCTIPAKAYLAARQNGGEMAVEEGKVTVRHTKGKKKGQVETFDLMEGVYPNWQQVMPEDPSRNFITVDVDSLYYLEKAFGRNKHHPVLTITPGKDVVKVEIAGVEVKMPMASEFHEEIVEDPRERRSGKGRRKGDGSCLRFGFNAELLRGIAQALDARRDGRWIVNMFIKDSFSPAVITPLGFEQSKVEERGLLMPVRIH